MAQGQSNPTPTPEAAPSDPIAQSIDQEMKEEKFGTPGQQVLTGIEGAAKGFAGPIATWAEKGLSDIGVPGLTPEEQEARAEVNPWTHGLAEAGTFAGSLLTGTGEAALLSKAGEAALPIAEAIGIGGKGAGMLGKIGSHVVRGAVENGLYQTGDEVSKWINDPNSIESAIPQIGLAAAIGGGIGLGGGAISEMWKSKIGPKVGGILNSVSKRLGGIEGIEHTPIDEIAANTGMELAPEIRSAMSDDPLAREYAGKLAQSPSNKGREFQESLQEARSNAGDALSQSLGYEPSAVPDEFDKNSHGKGIGEAIADKLDELVEPLKGEYEAHQGKFSGKNLDESIGERLDRSTAEINRAEKALTKAVKEAVEAQASGDPGKAIEAATKVEEAQGALKAAHTDAATPGTKDVLVEKLTQLADKEAWDPDGNIMKKVGEIQARIPKLKTLKDLTDLIQQVSEKLPFDPFNGKQNRAAGMIKGLLRDTESELIGSHIGSEAGQEAVESYRATQKAYSQASRLVDELETRTGKLGTTSQAASSLRDMSKTDAEKLARVFSGKNDADAIRFLNEHFPEAAEKVRSMHAEEILSHAKSDTGIDPHKVLKKLNALSPQQRDFVIPGGARSRVDAIETMIDHLKDTNRNWSNTGRQVANVMHDVSSSAVGMVAMLLGHNPAVSLLLGGLTKYASKEAPDAVRLGLLKWLGSNKPIEAGAFKTMVEMINSTMKGEALSNRATRALFSGANKVIPEHLFATTHDTENLDKKLKKVDQHPPSIEDANTMVGYYMPNHGMAMGATTANAVGYLNSLRPQSTKTAPLDSDIEPTHAENEKFNRALEIAQQPLTAVQHIVDNQLTSDDVTHLKTLYPSLYTRLSHKITDEMINHTSKGKEIPYDLRFGLSTFLGQALDSSFNPQEIQANQLAFIPSTQAHDEKQNAMTSPKASLPGMRDMKQGSRLSLHPLEEKA